MALLLLVLLALFYGGLAQLARAPALQAGGQRFESVILHYSDVSTVIVLVITITHYSLLLIRKEIFDILTQARL